MPAPISPLEAPQTAPESVPQLHCGDVCPHCGRGRLDYNGLLDLECPTCGYTLGGGAGCT